MNVSPVHTVDAIGTCCPVPILELAKAARQLAGGSLIVLWASDPAVEQDVQAWCAATGHELLAQRREPRGLCAEIRLRQK